MKVKWTPGPWKVEVTVNSHGGWRDPEQMVKITSEVRGEFTDGGLIAFYGTDYAEYGSDKENEANARLMATAPELLNALEEAELELDRYNGPADTLARVRAAIAKAKAA